jgi:hypothetical protein
MWEPVKSLAGRLRACRLPLLGPSDSEHQALCRLRLDYSFDQREYACCEPRITLLMSNRAENTVLGL